MIPFSFEIEHLPKDRVIYFAHPPPLGPLDVRVSRGEIEFRGGVEGDR